MGNIYLILQNPFYYGVFEYPKKSGNFYQGKHEPLITKELFDQVQKQVKSNVLKVVNKEFAFTRLMTCGLCGSGICADEKFKKLKNGGINRHVYYGCTKAKDKNCKCGYINEVELIKQLGKILDEINIDEIGMKDRIKTEIERIKKFNQSLLGLKQEINISDVDIRDYAKFILKDGEIEEKRKILMFVNNKIILKNKIIKLAK